MKPTAAKTILITASTIKELEKAGYIIRRQLRGANGRITDTETSGI